MEARSQPKDYKGKTPMASGSNQKEKKVESSKNHFSMVSSSKSPVKGKLRKGDQEMLRASKEEVPDVTGASKKAKQIASLVEALNRSILEQVSKLKRSADQVYNPIPISRALPSTEADPVSSTEAKKKTPTLIVEQKSSVSFPLLTQVDLEGIDLDQLEAPSGSKPLRSEASRVRRFSFIERLEGWKLERRVRSNGKRDMYYYYERTGETFRSRIEVVNFIMYEAYPRTREQETITQSNESTLHPTASDSRKRKEPSTDPIEVDDSPPLLLTLEDIDRMIDSTNTGAPPVTTEDDDLIDHIPICSSISELCEFLTRDQSEG